MVDLQPIRKEMEPLPVIVRRFRRDDVKALRPILSAWIKDRDTGEFLPDEVEEDLQIMLDSIYGRADRTYLVAEVFGRNEVVGVIGLKKPGKEMLKFTTTRKPYELVNAYVKPQERGGRGVGRALVKGLEETAKELGATEIVLNSGPRYKDTGWGFYDKQEGYSRVGVARNYYGEGGDAPVWRKEL